MTRRVFVVGLIVACDDDVEPPDTHDLACWLDGLRNDDPLQGATVIVDATVWDTLGDLVGDLCDARAIKADRVLAAIGKAELSRAPLVAGVPRTGPGKSDVRL